MNKIKVTPQQRLNALYARDTMWPAVPPEQVVRELCMWRCKTHHCFGGQCAIDPYFRQLGLMADNTGCPTFEVDSDGVACEAFASVSESIFGHTQMFHPRDSYPNKVLRPLDFGFEGTDHELVTHRLNWLIENSEVIEND